MDAAKGQNPSIDCFDAGDAPLVTAIGIDGGPAETDPRTLMLSAPLSRAQITAIAILVALCALDGFDVLAMTFAAPAVASNWGLGKAVLGSVFSSGLIGMAVGSFVIAPAADRFGRRRLVLLSLAMMVMGSFWSAAASSVAVLIMSRVLTGLGVGAMIAVINPLAAEYANTRRRNLAIGLLNSGYPIGGIGGGLLAAHLLSHHGWRAIFESTAFIGLAMVVVVWWGLPEPIAPLLARRTTATLQRVNDYLARCGHPLLTGLPPLSRSVPLVWRDLFRSNMRATTLKTTGAYFLYVMTNFYLQSWTSALVGNLGFSASQAAVVSVWVSVGGILGGCFIGVASNAIGLRRMVILAQIGAGLFITLFGSVPANLLLLKGAAALAGFFTFGAMIGLYAVIAQSFPVEMRASGTGFVIGCGRLGSALSPALAGFLFATGLHAGEVSAMMVLPAILSAVVLLTHGVTSKAPARSSDPSSQSSMNTDLLDIA